MKGHRYPLLLTVAGALCVAATAGAQVTKTSPGDVAVMTQKNLVDRMIVGDSLEVEAAQLAATRTQNATVRDFATMLATDHQAHLDNLRKLAGKAEVGREASTADSSGAALTRALDQLKATAPDSGFDKTFISAQVENHEREIAALKQLRSSATDEELLKDIDATVPVLERHLARAKEISAQLNTPTGAAAKPPTDATPNAAPAAANPSSAAVVTPKPAADSVTAKKAPADSTKKPVVPKPPV